MGTKRYSRLRSEVAENCALLGYYAARSGNFLPTFRDNLSVPSSGFKNPKTKTGHYVLDYGIKNFDSKKLRSPVFARTPGIIIQDINNKQTTK